MGVLVLAFSVFLISASFYFETGYKERNYMGAIEKAKTIDYIEIIKNFLVENLEYQQSLEKHRSEIYLYSGLLLLISSLVILSVCRINPNKSLKQTD